MQAPAAAVERVVAQWGTAEPDGDDACVLRMSVDELHWPVLVLAAVGAEFEVESPPELTVQLMSIGELFRKAN